MTATSPDVINPPQLTTLGITCRSRPLESFPANLDALAAAGFEYVYLSDLFYFVRTEGGLAALQQALAGSGIKIISSHFGPLYPGPNDSLEAFKVQHLHDLDTAAALGLRHVTTHYVWITGTDDPSFVHPDLTKAQRFSSVQGSPAVWEEAIRKLGGREMFFEKNHDLYRWFCDEAATRGITPTIETATCQFSRTPAQLIEVIKTIDRPNLGICLDSGHSHIMGVNVGEAVRQCGSYLKETHFHDNFGDLDLHRPVGIGTINWSEAILALRESDYNGPITFETGGVSGQTFEEELSTYAQNWKELLHTTLYRDRQKRAFCGPKSW